MNDIRLIRTDSSNNNFIMLVEKLDKELAERDGDEHPFYAQFNKIDNIKNAVVAYINDSPAGCGAIKKYSEDTAEIKRMYVNPGSRGHGIAMAVLKELEKWAGEQGFLACILETGKKQPEAIALYTKAGYEIITNYGQYIGIENSVCMKKTLS